MLEGFQEHILHCIASLLAITKQSHQSCKYTSGMPARQFLKSIGVSNLDPSHQSAVRIGRWRINNDNRTVCPRLRIQLSWGKYTPRRKIRDCSQPRLQGIQKIVDPTHRDCLKNLRLGESMQPQRLRVKTGTCGSV